MTKKCQIDINYLPWDGSFIGEITQYVVFTHVHEDRVIIVFYNGVMCTIEKYINNIPLIVDELKIYFDLIKIGRHQCLFNNKKYIMSKFQKTDKNFVDRDDSDNIKMYHNDVCKCYLFRY